jgi:hypothetical protein
VHRWPEPEQGWIAIHLRSSLAVLGLDFLNSIATDGEENLSWLEQARPCPQAHDNLHGYVTARRVDLGR